MKKSLLILCVFILSSGIALSNGLSLNSPGPKALGMGGAFVGVADDLSAIYWNPAGLTQTKVPNISIFYTGIMPTSTYKMEQMEIDAKTESKLHHAPGFFAAMPCQLVEGVTLGLGVFIPAGLGTEWVGKDLTAFSSGEEYEWMSQIGVVEISPTIAYEINDMFSVGAAFNIHYGMVDIKQFNVGQYEEESTGMGYGVTIGAMFKPVKDFSIGVTFKSENSIAFEGTAKNSALSGLYPTFGLTYKDADISRDLAWPMWIGGGVAYKVMDNLTIAVDVQYSQWSATEDEVETTYENWLDLTEFAQGNEVTMKEKLILHWEDQMQIRFGVQYDVNEE